jgi:hypothetical protein
MRDLDDGKGWVCFRLQKGDPSDIELSQLLGKTVAEWIRENPQAEVLGTAAIVSGGRTVGINLWYRNRRVQQGATNTHLGPKIAF